METSLPSGGGLTFHGAAGVGRNGFDDGSSGVEFRFQRGQCPAGVDAPVVLFSSFIYAFGCFTLMVFFFVFHRARP
jgi:hypothetical protein